MKVLTVLGTRPEIIRLCRTIALLDVHFEHILVHTGQNFDYELNKVFFEDLEVRKPDYFLDSAGESAAKTIGNVISAVDEVLEKEQPEAVLILGDTNSGLAVIPAKRRKIPIFHMEAGNRSFDLRVPEEINRKIIDHTSDINLPYSTIARNYLIEEGFPPDQVIKTGSPMYEVLAYYKDKIEASTALLDLGIKPQQYFVVSTHREENVDKKRTLEKIASSLNEICEKYKMPIILSTHPRTRKRLDEHKIRLNHLVRDLKPLGFLDYVKLQNNSFCVISDSGTITEESSILDFPAVNLRESHERPEGMEEGAVVMTGLSAEDVICGIEIATSASTLEDRRTKLVDDYYAPDVSSKVTKIIASYTGFVRRRVWKEY